MSFQGDIRYRRASDNAEEVDEPDVMKSSQKVNLESVLPENGCDSSELVGARIRPLANTWGRDSACEANNVHSQDFASLKFLETQSLPTVPSVKGVGGTLNQGELPASAISNFHMSSDTVNVFSESDAGAWNSAEGNFNPIERSEQRFVEQGRSPNSSTYSPHSLLLPENDVLTAWDPDLFDDQGSSILPVSQETRNELQRNGDAGFSFCASPVPRSQQSHPVPGHSASPQLSHMRSKAQERSESKNRLLIHCKQEGMSYKAIKEYGGFEEAESTLRGRYRTLIKRKDQRPRKPEWTKGDVCQGNHPIQIVQVSLSFIRFSFSTRPSVNLHICLRFLEINTSTIHST